MKLYRTMNHQGGLEEAIKTQSHINPYLAKYLIEKKIYKEYGYDERIKAKRYIFKGPMEKWPEIPTWLLEYDEEDTINRLRRKLAKLRGKTK